MMVYAVNFDSLRVVAGAFPAISPCHRTSSLCCACCLVL